MSELLSWIDADYIEWPMNGEQGITALAGRLGAFAPPLNVIEMPVPGQAGARLRDVLPKVRQVDVPVIIQPPTRTPQAYRTLVRDFANALLKGSGVLRATGPDNVPRDLVSIYSAGLEGAERNPSAAWSQEVLSFRGQDPYWYDKDFTSVLRTTGAATQFFPVGGTPSIIHLSADGVLSAFLIDNSGDIEAWPIWTINGPGTSIVLQNLSTGMTLDLTNSGGLSVLAGQTLTIDTRPGRKSITLQDGSSKFSYLTFSSSLWPLVRGSNDINVSMGSTSSASSVQLQYKRGWRVA